MWRLFLFLFLFPFLFLFRVWGGIVNLCHHHGFNVGAVLLFPRVKVVVTLFRHPPA